MSLLDSERLAIAESDAAVARTRDSSFEALRVCEHQARFAAAVFHLRLSSRLLQFAHGDAFQAITLAGACAEVVVLDLARLSLAALHGGITGTGRAAPRIAALEASAQALPFGRGSFDFVVEFGGAWALTAEDDAEAERALAGIRRVLRRGGRYLSGEPEESAERSTGAKLSPDRRRVDEWHRGAGGVWRHSLQIVRPDGTWQRLHERRRRRSSRETEMLLTRNGFSVLGAFRAYRQDSRVTAGTTSPIVLCEAI